jgi:hypothetical protein
MEPMNLLVARKAVADDVRRKSSYGDTATRTTRITRRRVLGLLRRVVMTKSSTPAPRVVAESLGD